MVLAWILTIPCAAVVAWLVFHLTQLPVGLAWVTVGGIWLAFAAWAGWAMTHTIHAQDVEAEVPSEEELDLRDSLQPYDIARDPSTAPAEHTTRA